MGEEEQAKSADLPRRYISAPHQSRGWALGFASAFS